ncbi:tetratricopeptide repeat protein [Psychroserpens burtonensis]|uniref:Tetratricopeptide repeat protein n=1 Tax=Psychroserpens burtonensis TaxID=49278 RepID=A0A5C7BEQ2_9FLAO|nr:tetratricopeptide repeat protein [Psychroserpens burtonensis]TXE19375.1 tetratricopeptide repeat protein [Psychroserpens burtonensis]
MRLLFVLICVLTISNTEAQTSILNQADSLYRNGNYSKAIEAYKTHTNQDEVSAKIAKANVAIGNYDAALEYYKLGAAADPKNGLVLYEYAKLLSKTKNFEASIEVFNTLMNIDYRNPNYHYEMGLALERIGNSTALNRFWSAYDLDQTHQKAIFKIAKHFLIKRKHQISHRYIDEGLESYKNNIELTSLKAQNYYYQEDYENARTWFQKLINLGESSEFIHAKLSMIHAEFLDYELAIAQRKLVLKSNPYNADAMFLIGKYYNQLKDYKSAEKYIKQALVLQDVPLDYEYQILGTVLNRQDKHKEAIEALQKSVKENPENISSEFYIVSTKDKYYLDIETKIKLYEDFRDKYPNTVYSKFASQRIIALKEEKFLKAED